MIWCILGGLVAYLLAGVVYALVQWFKTVNVVVDRYDTDGYCDWMRGVDELDITDESPFAKHLNRCLFCDIWGVDLAMLILTWPVTVPLGLEWLIGGLDRIYEERLKEEAP